MKKIASMGEGDRGKTSFVPLMTKCFIENGDTPLLLIDVDPYQTLGEMVGVDLKEDGERTISELPIETFLEEQSTTVEVPDSSAYASKYFERLLIRNDVE